MKSVRCASFKTCPIFLFPLVEQQVLLEYEASQGLDEVDISEMLQTQDPNFVICPVCQK